VVHNLEPSAAQDVAKADPAWLIVIVVVAAPRPTAAIIAALVASLAT